MKPIDEIRCAMANIKDTQQIFVAFLEAYVDFNPPLKILLFDDEPDITLWLGLALEHSGLEVRASTQYSEEVFITELKTADILVLDYNMPVLGTEIAKVARNIKPNIKIIFITAYDNVADLENEIVLHKPFSIDELLKKIRTF